MYIEMHSDGGPPQMTVVRRRAMRYGFCKRQFNRFHKVLYLFYHVYKRFHEV